MYNTVWEYQVPANFSIQSRLLMSGGESALIHTQLSISGSYPCPHSMDNLPHCIYVHIHGADIFPRNSHFFTHTFPMDILNKKRISGYKAREDCWKVRA